MLEYWQQAEKNIALEWGTLGFEQQESIRSEFKDFEKIKVTGKQTFYFPQRKKNWLLLKSFGQIFAFCSVVIGTVAGIYKLRAFLSSYNEDTAGSAALVSSFLNAFQVQFFGYLYTNYSEQLTDSENHRTDSEYEDRLDLFTNPNLCLLSLLTSFFSFSFSFYYY